MNALELVQRTHYEARLPGAPPTSLIGQSGRAGDVVRWTVEAYNDIQREHDGRWNWLFGTFQVDTVASDPSYAYSECTDVELSGEITRFRAWHWDDYAAPLIYLVADGKSTEGDLLISDWAYYRHIYYRGEHTASKPGIITADPRGVLYLGPTPDDIYRVTGNFWRGNQVLAADEHEPEMPVDYHMAIVYRAILKYGYTEIAGDVVARCQAEGQPLFDALTLNQSYARATIRTGPALA